MENIWTGFLKQQPEPHIEQASILWKGEEEEGRREGGRGAGRRQRGIPTYDSEGDLTSAHSEGKKKRGGRWGGKSAGMS